MLFQTVAYMLTLLASSSTCVHSLDLTHVKTSNADSSQISCIMALLQKYFQSGEPLSGSVITMSLTSTSSSIQQELLNAIYAQDNIPWTVVVRRPHEMAISEASTAILQEKPQCYFLVIENFEDADLEVVYGDWKSHINWNPIAQFVVYLATVEETERDMNDLMIAIMLSFMSKKVYNINVIGRHKGATYFFGKTVFPYHPENSCGNRVVAIDTLDICHYGNLKSETADGQADAAEDGDEGGDGTGYTDGGSNEDENGGGNGNGDVNAEGVLGGTGVEGGYGDREGIEGGDRCGSEDGDVDRNEEKKRGMYEVRDQDGKEHDDEDKHIYVDGELKDKGTNEDIDMNENGDELGADIGEIGNGCKYVNRDVDRAKRSIAKRGAPGAVDMRREWNMEGNEDQDVSAKGNGNSDDDEGGENGNGETRNGNANDNGEGEKVEGWNINVDGGVEGEGNQDSEDSGVNRDKIATSNPHKGHQKKVHSHKLQQPINLNESPMPNIHLQELHRGLFADKVPKDLSGCPISAAYRPWEPYIFKERETADLSSPTEKPEEQSATTLSKPTSTEESKSYIYEYVYSAVDDDDDTYMDTDSANSDLGSVNVNNAKPTTAPKPKLNGIEYQLVQTIGELLHIQIDLQVESYNLYLLFQQLIDGEVEMIFGGIDEDPSISQYVSSAIPYHQDDLTWCVAKAKRNYQLFNVFYSFDISVWLLTMVVILIVAMNVCIAQKLLNLRLLQFRGIFATFSRIFGMVLSQSAYIWHLPISLRITFFGVGGFALIFVTSYQSFLVSTLTTPKSSYQISHLEEIYQNRMSVAGNVDNVRHLTKEGEIFQYIRQNFKMCYNIEECLNHATTDELMAVAVSRQHSFYNPRIQRDDLYCFDRNENIYIYLVTMLLPKKFHLLHKINHVIEGVTESGLMEKWARDLDMGRKIRDQIRQAQVEPVKELTIKQVVGAFVVHAMLLALALIIFCLELWTHWMVVKRRTRLRFLRKLHRKLYGV